MKISLEKIQQKAAERPPGYLEDCLAVGELRGDGFVYFRAAAYYALRAKYCPKPKLISTSQISNLKSAIRNRKLSGLGDAVALLAKPIARTIDRIAGTKLENCKPCARRQAKLNAAVPFKRTN